MGFVGTFFGKKNYNYLSNFLEISGNEVKAWAESNKDKFKLELKLRLSFNLKLDLIHEFILGLYYLS